MLEFLRKSASSIFMKALLVVLIASFAAWGIGDIFRTGGSSNSVASVGDSEIGIDAFNAEFGRDLARISQSMGQPLTREQAIAMGVDGMVLDRMVNLQILQQGANAMQLMASDAVIAQAIKETPDFFNKDGQFDRRIYTELLSRAGLSEAAYVAQVRSGTVRQQYLSPISNGLMAPKPLIGALYKLAAETRVLDVVRIEHGAIKGVAVPTDAELAQYHQDNAARFMAPQYREATALVLTLDDVAKTITVTDAELQAAYDDHAGDYTTPETRDLSQIFVKDEAAAAKAGELLAQGQSMADAAQAVGASPAMMKLGKFTRAEAEAMSADLAAAVFATPVGGYTQPVKSPLGWHVVKVEAITPGSVKALDEVKDELRKTISTEHAADALYKASNDLQDMLGGGQTLEEAAQSLGVNVLKLNIDANAQGTDNKPVDAPYAAEITAKAFELGEGQESLLVDTQDTHGYFVVRVDGITQPALRPLDTIKIQVSGALMAERRAEQAAEVAKQVEDRLKAGEDAASIAKDMGFAAFTTDPFNRAGQGLKLGALPATLLNTAFAQPQGGVVTGAGTGATTVAQVKSIAGAEIDPNNAQYKAIHDRVLRDMQGDVLAQLTSALQQRFPVKVNQAALKDFAN